jgi:hypothetical protein
MTNYKAGSGYPRGKLRCWDSKEKAASGDVTVTSRGNLILVMASGRTRRLAAEFAHSATTPLQIQNL